MAVTGTGTQNDPFIPTTFEDFCTCMASSPSNYVELPADAEDKTFNMNDYYPEGITSALDWSANLNGNGWSIMNAVVANSTFAFTLNASNTYKNINFYGCWIKSNIYIDPNTGDTTLLGGNFFQLNSPMNSSFLMENIKVTARLDEGSEFFGGNFVRSNRSGTVNKANFQLEMYDNTSICSSQYGILLKNCYIEYDFRGTTGVNNTWFGRTADTTFHGKYPVSAMNLNVCNRLVIDLEGITELKVAYAQRSTVNKVIVNTDKYVGTIPAYGDIIQASSAQLQDATYLASQGFPATTAGQ